MTRSKKLGIMLAILIVVAVGAVAATGIYSGGDEAQTGETILTVDTDQVTSLSWSYNGEKMTFDRSDESWQYADDADFR